MFRSTTVLLTLLAACASLGHAAEPDQRPNVLLILADDLGYGDLSCMGAADLRTPHVDAIARRGLRFTNFYANCPVCSPTRAALLTGRYQELVGVPGVIRTHAENNWGHLSESAVLLPSVLRPAGYHSGIVGKWHLGLESPNTPLDRGFNEFHGFLGDMMDDYYTHLRHGNNYMRHGRDEIHPEGHATDLFTDWACEFIQTQNGDQPWFLYLAYNAPHTPIQPPAEAVDAVLAREPGISERRAKLVALIEHMDAGIGRVVDAVDRQQTDTKRSTLVIFTSDNGGQTDVGANNGPLRDGKQSVYEGGLKVPACVAWIGSNRIAAGSTTDFRAMSMDLFPTICELAGATVNHPIDGRSLVPTLIGKQQQPLRDLWFFTRREGGVAYQGKTIDAVIKGNWKLLQNSPFAPLELYDLAADPLEQTDMAKSNRAVFNALSVELRQQIQRSGTVPWQRADD